MTRRFRNTNGRLAITALALLSALSAHAQDVTTGGYGNARQNANLFENSLTPASVKPGSFGNLFALPVDGQIYAQPLYQRNIAIPGKGTHNVVFVATMHNTVYAFDADSPSTPLWSVNLGPSVPTANYASDTGAYADILPENGILGTPAIDPATGTLYVVAATFDGTNYGYQLHALDTTSGAERFGAPVAIAAQATGVGDNSVNGTVALDPSQHLQRPALLLANGIVYVAFGSHGDAAPYHGWLLGYSAQNVGNQVASFNTSPNGSGGAIWQSGRGPTADDDGNVYVVASNGDTDEQTSFSDNVLKLDPSQLTVTDWFAPFNFQDLNEGDDDLGSSGAIFIDGTNYLVTGGKQGTIYLLDRMRLGNLGEGDSQIPQSFSSGGVGTFNMALWNRADGPVLYIHTINSPVVAYKMQGAAFGETPVAQSVGAFAVPYQGMTLSANGSQTGSGVLWVLAPEGTPDSPGVLHAYDAGSLDEIWNSDMAPTDAVGGYVKFANPTVANGKVYVPTGSNQLLVYGLKSNDAVSTSPVVTGIVNAASYAAGSLAPGEIVTILGQNLGPQDIAVGSFDANGEFSDELAGTQVTFNGVPGPLIYAWNTAVSAVVPYETAGSDNIVVALSSNGQDASPQTMTAAAAAPGIFSANASGSGPGSILNQDYTLNGPDNPAAAGSIVVVYATGGGPTNPPAATGSLTAAAASIAAETQVTVGGRAAQVLYAGNAGGLVAGVLQINLRLPDGIEGTVPVVVTAGGQSSQATVTVSIQ